MGGARAGELDHIQRGGVSMEVPVPPPEPADQVSTDGATTATPGRRKLKRSSRIALTVILIVALVAAGGFATDYFLNARNYVTTDNAQIDGDKILVNAPTSGTLIGWDATQGTELRKDQI